MSQGQRDFAIGLYAAGLVMLAEGILEVFSAHGATLWSSSGQRHVVLGALLFVIPLVLAWNSRRKKHPKERDSNRPS